MMNTSYIVKVTRSVSGTRWTTYTEVATHEEAEVLQANLHRAERSTVHVEIRRKEVAS